MENSSNPRDDSMSIHDRASVDASNTNVSNFVSVKLSGHQNYHLWKNQMLRLMKTHAMYDPGDDPARIKIIKKYDSLVHGWIFGSLSDNVLRLIIDLESAQDIWDKLECYFDPTVSSKRDYIEIQHDKHGTSDDAATSKNLIIAKVETKKELEDKNMTDLDIEDNGTNLNEPEGKTTTNLIGTAPTDNKKETDDLQPLIKEGDWYGVYEYLETNKALNHKIKNGNTILHIAVGIHYYYLVNLILHKIDKDELTTLTNLDGSTVLHIAAMVGNTNAALDLVEKNQLLLNTKDNKDQTPFEIACEYMHFKTIESLLDAVQNQEKDKKATHDDGTKSSYQPPVKTGVQIVVNAVSAKEYDLALKLIDIDSQYAVSDDHVLMAIARTFPSGLDYWETFIYPSLDKSSDYTIIVTRTRTLFEITVRLSSTLKQLVESIFRRQHVFGEHVMHEVMLFLIVPIFGLFYWMYLLILLLQSMVRLPFSMIYLQFWKAAKNTRMIKSIERKKKDLDLAKQVLVQVCKKIPDSNHDFYRFPILLAACQDAYEVVDEILYRYPEAISYKDNDGYGIIQLATIHRSKRVYELVNIFGEIRSVYRTFEDPSNNNMLHLAGRLAPSNKLARITGAALKLQRELQWRQEVEKLVFPSYLTKENIFEDTPAMVFTKEHNDLMKEGEKWMKTVATSCSITTTLVITIVFAAAITVPGGSTDHGFPVFNNEIAFSIFATADAISLFSSTTALLVFLSILTARFSEEDFLILLPRRLIIGLCTLLISTAAMMVAFGATLILVSTPHKWWVIAPICVFAFLPIAFFFVLQFPLIIDLYWSTYKFKFATSETRRRKFDPNRALFFGK